MAQEVSQLELRLSGGQDPDGQISLEVLARLAAKTQGVVTSLARGGTGQRLRGRPRAALTRATRLYLTGIHHGSTVIRLIGAAPDEVPLKAEEMPPGLGDFAIGLLADSLEVLSAPENAAQGLPADLDQESVRDLAEWLRELRPFAEVSVRAVAGNRQRMVSLEPKNAVATLNRLSRGRGIWDRPGQLHAAQGRLFAVNLHTGRFAIEDDMGHTLGLTVPDELRSTVAQMIDRRVRVTGQQQFDDNDRLVGILVADVELVPELEALAQGSFFERHELVFPPAQPGDAMNGVVDDLSDEEAARFMATLARDD